MASHQESLSMALFCDFENVALGVRDAQFDKFDIKPVLERLLLKGSIVVKKAYCDWDRYKGFKAAMHEANFELIEIPHVRQSGKNSADIRLVVDALDLCYTKSHVDTFVIISGDSDFSPLVSKLRENAKQVIGVGIKQSTSDLLIANCDEFIFYDDLVRESQRTAAKREPRGAQSAGKRSPEEEKGRKDELEARRTKAIDLAVATYDALVSERGDSGKMWASVLKEAIKRRRPDFNESYYGFRAFGNLLQAAQERGLIEVGRDEKSGTYVFRSDTVGEDPDQVAESPAPVRHQSAVAAEFVAPEASTDAAVEVEAPIAASEGRRKGRGGRKQLPRHARPSGQAAAQGSTDSADDSSAGRSAPDSPVPGVQAAQPDSSAVFAPAPAAVPAAQPAAVVATASLEPARSPVTAPAVAPAVTPEPSHAAAVQTPAARASDVAPAPSPSRDPASAQSLLTAPASTTTPVRPPIPPLVPTPLAAIPKPSGAAWNEARSRVYGARPAAPRPGAPAIPGVAAPDAVPTAVEAEPDATGRAGGNRRSPRSERQSVAPSSGQDAVPPTSETRRPDAPDASANAGAGLPADQPARDTGAQRPRASKSSSPRRTKSVSIQDRVDAARASAPAPTPDVQIPSSDAGATAPQPAAEAAPGSQEAVAPAKKAARKRAAGATKTSTSRARKSAGKSDVE